MATKTKPPERKSMPKVAAKTTAPAPAVQEKRQVAQVHDGGISPELLKKMEATPGGGLSKAASDNLVPLIYLLQPLSPQVMKGNPARIEGAEAGDIWLRNAEPPIASGDKGLIFQPCHFYKDIVEWIPDRGGFAGRHDISCMPDPDLRKFDWTGTLKDVEEVRDEDEPNAWPRFVRKSNGNEVVETRYYAGFVYPEVGQPMPYIIPLSSTGHSFGKQWMVLQNSQTLPNGRPNQWSWAVLYRLTTIMKTNSKGSWYMYEVQKERWADDDEFDRGTSLNNAFTSGAKKIDDDMMMRDKAGTKPSSDMESNDEGDM